MTRDSSIKKKWSGSISRILSSLPSEDHSSATRVAAVVEQPTRKLSTETGGSNASLFGLAPQGVCHAGAAHAVRGALLPHRFTLASASFETVRRSVLCCTFRRVAAPGRYPACCPWEFGLSSACAAILRATPLADFNRLSANKNPADKSLLIKRLRFHVGAPTSKFLPIFRVGKVRLPILLFNLLLALHGAKLMHKFVCSHAAHSSPR